MVSLINTKIKISIINKLITEINYIISTILNKITMSSNNITSINNLINNDQEDEDRKFLRAAAEAIVATSMNNEIDPTILELLRRIQYANAPNPGGATTSGGGGGGGEVNTINPLQQRQNGHIGTSSHAINNFIDESTNTNSTRMNSINSINSINSTNSKSLINPAKNSHHFPTFNLNYFENLAEQNNNNGNSNSNNNISKNHEESIGPTNITSSNITSQDKTWSLQSNSTTQSNITSPIESYSHGSNGSIESKNSINSNDIKPFICQDCSLSFRRSSDLRRHQRAHLPILPHICKMCGKGFARKDALKRHSDTLTCKRNREKLLSSGGDVESILNEAKRQGHDL